MRAEAEKCIAGVPHYPSALVWTFWDLGIRDSTAIWFVQVVGREIRIIDYYEAREPRPPRITSRHYSTIRAGPASGKSPPAAG
jgi:hypothetical protein